MPVATNCTVVPLAADGLGGVTWIDDRVAAVTVSVVEPETPPNVAVIVVVPVVSADASPCEPPALEIVATVAFVDRHVACDVRFCVVPSLYTAVAAKLRLVPSAIDGLVGVTWIETTTALVTVRFVDAFRPPNVAEIDVVPTLLAVATPCEPAAFEIVATVPS